jgi:ABC-type transport system involved in cytochrome bd biosynthesis fused ATPase/permease subunit
MILPWVQIFLWIFFLLLLLSRCVHVRETPMLLLLVLLLLLLLPLVVVRVAAVREQRKQRGWNGCGRHGGSCGKQT